MELMEDLDPEEARAIVDPALKLMMDAVHHYDGYVVQSTGDGIFALFGAPAAHEDHPQRALYAGLRLQEQLKRYSDRLRGQGRLPLQARVGLNTGEVVVRSLKTGESHTEYIPIGHSTGLAARMQTLAPVGSIAATDATRKLGEGYFTFKSLGPTVVKGVSEPVEVSEVTGLGTLRTRLQRSAVRGLTKFVGRERDMEALKHAAELSRAGHGQVVAAMAEAGVGKSRLLYEFKVKNQTGWMVLEAFSVSHGKASAYLPVLDLLHSYFGLDPGDDSRKRREKVAGRITMLDRALEDALPYLFGLLGLTEGDDPLAEMDAQIRRRRTLEALKRILLRESLNQPLMIIFEDLHWIDEETQAFLNLLADSIGTAKLLLLVNYRPEYSHQWNSKTYYTQLRLDPLSREWASEMLDALLGVSTQAAEDPLVSLKRLIIEKTEGNPFFMEEIVQALFEEGALVRNGTVKLTKSLYELKIPPTVQAILASRIDRLPAREKDLLQTLAVIGGEFPLGLARVVTGRSDEELARMLDTLQVGEFIYEQPAAGDVEYTFKHALTQEVAYNSVLQGRRKAVHERIGQSIEALYHDSLDDHIAELARHYRRSGNAAKAIDSLLLAAERAIERNARSEAIASLREGLDLLAAIADERERTCREGALQLALCGAIVLGNPAAPGGEEEYQRARALCERIGDREGVFLALLGLRRIYNFRAELDRALELSEELLKIADNAEPGAQLAAHASAAQTLYFRGELNAARQHLEQARGMAAGDTRRGVWLRMGQVFSERRERVAVIRGLLGYPDRAVQEDREGLEYAREMRVPFAVALAEAMSAQLYYFLREVRKVREHGEAAVRIANEWGSSHLSGYAAAFLGWVEALQGDAAEGIREIGRAIEMVELAGSKIHSLQNTLLVECHLRNGAIEVGLAAASEALRHAQNSGERYCASELNRLRGELLLLRGGPHHAEAESAFRTAIEVARGQQARLWELRATSSLAWLLRDTGRRGEARAMLAEIYGWFTEGFDTADLKDAKALLDELGG